MGSPMTTTRPVPSALAATAVIALAIGLSGCIDPGSGFAVLDRPAEAGDALPVDVPDSDDLSFDPASARFVADDDGTRLYLAEGRHSTTCLLVYSDDAEPFIGCGGGGWFGIGDRRVRYEVRADGMAAPDDATALSPNVYRVDD